MVSASARNHKKTLSNKKDVSFNENEYFSWFLLIFIFLLIFLDSFESYEPIILNLNNLFSSIVIKMRQNNPNPESTQKPY